MGGSEANSGIIFHLACLGMYSIQIYLYIFTIHIVSKQLYRKYVSLLWKVQMYSFEGYFVLHLNSDSVCT